MRHFLEGKASVYALIAKDQLMSFQDLTCSACSVRERAEVEASARSQREAAEARAAAAGALQRSAPGGGEDDVWNEVAAASSLADAQMDEQWRAVSVWPRYVTCLCVRPAGPGVARRRPKLSATYVLPRGSWLVGESAWLPA